jgi:hypothetical protein
LLAVLLTLTLFLAWWAIGTAAMTVLRVDTGDLRVILTAPILGTALTVVPLFILSDLGLGMERAGPAVGATLLASSVAVLLVRRPRLPLAVAPVVVLAVVDLVLVGRPLFHFGFDWIANANGDMGFYVLAATQLVHHGLLSPVDVHALAQDRGFPTYAQTLDLEGIRPGAQITVAGVAATFGRSPLSAYMPTLVALNMCSVCAVGSLAMQATRRWWAASVAAALLVTSPLAAYGVVQQLMPQVWGLGLAIGLGSWLLRPEMHEKPVPPLADLLVVTLLTISLFVVYVELGSSVLVSYVIYVGLLAWRRRLSLRALAVLWTVPVAATVLVVNAYLPNELRYLRSAASFGLSNSAGGVRLFGYALIPSALAGVTGLQKLFSAPTTPGMGFSIVVSAALLICVLALSLTTARRGSAAAVIVVGDAVITVWLGAHSNDFGLFKLYMYVQPFIAAGVAAWLGGLRTRSTVVAASVVLALVAAVQVSRLDSYVSGSFDPVDLRHASGPQILPTFRHLLATASTPVVSASENFTLLELEGAIAGDRPVYFLSRNVFNLPWKEEQFRLPGASAGVTIKFGVDPGTSRVLAKGSCVVSLPSGTQVALNRRTLPEGTPDLVNLPCDRAKNILAFITSNRGQPPTLPLDDRAVSLWQLVDDPSFPGKTLSGAGRFALFRILGPTPTVRVVLTLTNSPMQRPDGSHRLPPAAVVGSTRVRFPVAGSGSARVISAPLSPKIIAGVPYLVLDMGVNGELPVVRRPGLTGLWGKSVVIDPRFLTSYVRDISVISPAAYSHLRAPKAIRKIPADLGNPDLEYSGIYEDGWLGGDSYAYLAGGGATHLLVRLAIPAGTDNQSLRVLVDGRVVYRRAERPGPVRLDLPLRGSAGRRRVELLWSKTTRLPAPDGRSVTAQLELLAEG